MHRVIVCQSCVAARNYIECKTNSKGDTTSISSDNTRSARESDIKSKG